MHTVYIMGFFFLPHFSRRWSGLACITGLCPGMCHLYIDAFGGVAEKSEFHVVYICGGAPDAVKFQQAGQVSGHYCGICSGIIKAWMQGTTKNSCGLATFGILPWSMHNNGIKSL